MLLIFRSSLRFSASIVASLWASDVVVCFPLARPPLAPPPDPVVTVEFGRIGVPEILAALPFAVDEVPLFNPGLEFREG